MAAVVLSWGAVALAVVLQHGFGMRPCVWCVLQRLVFIAVGAAALLALAVGPGQVAGRVLALVAMALSVGGISAALYQQLVAAQTSSCPFGLADKIIMALDLDELLPWLFKASAPCDEANVPLFGVPFAIWSAALFVVLGSLSLAAGASRRAT